IYAAQPNLLLPKPIALPPQIGTLPPSLWACDPSFQYGAIIGLPPLVMVLEPVALRAWMTDTEGNSPVPAISGNLIRGTSVSEFQPAREDGQHLDELANFCLFLIQNGSGTGACSCGSGDSFSKAPEPTAF